GRATGTRWTAVELSPGDSPLVHGGRLTVATAARDAWSLAPGRLGAERDRFEAIRQDAHAPGLDLEGDALVLVRVLPFVAHGPAFDQHAHALLVQRLPVPRVAMPQFHRRPEAAAVLIL